MSCNFGLKSSLRFQIELVLRGRPILKSRKISNLLHWSTQFNYHYKYGHGWILDKHYITFLVVYCCPFARLELIFLNGSSARAISSQKFALLHCPTLEGLAASCTCFGKSIQTAQSYPLHSSHAFKTHSKMYVHQLETVLLIASFWLDVVTE